MGMFTSMPRIIFNMVEKTRREQSKIKNMKYQSTKKITLGSCAFRQWRATHSHCSKVHGYNLEAKFWFEADELDDKNWIVDFGGLKEFKKQLELQFDHTYCVAKDDPEFDWFMKAHEKGILDIRVMEEGVGIEKTAEFCFNAANKFLNRETEGRCRCVKVEVFEHDNNSATYGEEYLKVKRGKISPEELSSQSIPPGMLESVKQWVNQNLGR